MKQLTLEDFILLNLWNWGMYINLPLRTMFILHLNTSVWMNIYINYLSREATISFLLKMAVVNSFNICITYFPEIVVSVVYWGAILIFCLIFIWSDWKSSRIEKPNSVKFVIRNFMLFVKCMFLHQLIIQNIHYVIHNMSTLTCFGT
jgi:hypothetical protein